MAIKNALAALAAVSKLNEIEPRNLKNALRDRKATYTMMKYVKNACPSRVNPAIR
jgi:exonuclease I